ncbi:MAG: gamma-glutamyltransferase [Planctomycetes bacterium]|nr:gamma-glutamyltransferase [Planctomycetota bacterium]
MKTHHWITSIWLSGVLLGVAIPLGDSIAADQCVVAAVQPLAVDAGIAAFRAGGNAVDAAVATALTLGVVDNHNSGLGGGCFVLIRTPDGSLIAIDGREKAPSAASRDMFLRDGKAQPELSTVGPLAVGVPGALAAYAKALEKCGERQLGDLLLPAAELAEHGFPIDRIYAAKLKDKAETLQRFPGSRTTLLKPNGTAYREGEILRQPDLARSYNQIAKHGIDWFYRGEFAERVGQWMKANGGILTAEDFANYQAVEREPIVTIYRDFKIVGFPPPSSGGVHVAQILNMLEQFPLADEYRKNPVTASHLMLEAMKFAFADRAYWLGDADFAKVPRGLVDKSYCQTLAARIRRDALAEVPRHSTPPRATSDLFGKHTTHIAAADSAGYWVAITATVNTSFGSKVIVPGTGIVLNNEMDDFSSQPGVPNAFGLIGAENNSVAPGKRPLSSMSPTIVLDANDQPVLTVGAAGGPKIITQVVQTIIRRLDFGQSLSDAVAAPRLHHQWQPDRVLAEEAVPEKILTGLRKIGHQIRTISASGVTQAVGRDEQGELVGVHDPRVPGKVGYAELELEVAE